MADAVKGLFRRQTQKIRERKSEATTVDDDFEGRKAALDVSEKAARDLAVHMRAYVTHMSAATVALNQIAEDLAALAPSSASSNLPAVLRVTGEALTEEAATMARVSERNVILPLENHLAQYKELHESYEKRRDARLEMDFFKRKVAGLEATAHTEKDKTRLPRNAGILEKWRSTFDDLNTKSIALADTHIENRNRTFGVVCAQIRWMVSSFSRKAAIGFFTLYDGTPPTNPPAEGYVEPSCVVPTASPSTPPAGPSGGGDGGGSPTAPYGNAFGATVSAAALSGSPSAVQGGDSMAAAALMAPSATTGDFLS